MVTRDRIRLTGLLREKPWKRGFFYEAFCPGDASNFDLAGVIATLWRGLDFEWQTQPRRMNESLTVTAPTVQLLVWIAERPRTYAETIEAWKTSCPRFAVWEDAVADRLVRIDRGCVLLTTAGKELLTRPLGQASH